MSDETKPRETSESAPQTPAPVTPPKDETPSDNDGYTFRDWASI